MTDVVNILNETCYHSWQQLCIFLTAVGNTRSNTYEHSWQQLWTILTTVVNTLDNSCERSRQQLWTLLTTVVNTVNTSCEHSWQQLWTLLTPVVFTSDCSSEHFEFLNLIKCNCSCEHIPTHNQYLFYNISSITVQNKNCNGYFHTLFITLLCTGHMFTLLQNFVEEWQDSS